MVAVATAAVAAVACTSCQSTDTPVWALAPYTCWQSTDTPTYPVGRARMRWRRAGRGGMVACLCWCTARGAWFSFIYTHTATRLCQRPTPRSCDRLVSTVGARQLSPKSSVGRWSQFHPTDRAPTELYPSTSSIDRVRKQARQKTVGGPGLDACSVPSGPSIYLGTDAQLFKQCHATLGCWLTNRRGRSK